MDIKLYKVEPATDLPGNKYWIKAVPIFAEIERSVTTPDGQTIYRNYDEEWIRKTVQNHLVEQKRNNHLLPLKIGHSVPGKEVIRQSAGLLKIVGCDYTMYNGEPKLTIFADLLVPERVYHGMIDLEYPGASVEIWRPDDFRLSNCALLPDQDAEFKFPPIIPEELSRQFMECVPVNEDEFKLCIFSEFREDTMNREYKGSKQFASARRREVNTHRQRKQDHEDAKKASGENFQRLIETPGGVLGASREEQDKQRKLEHRVRRTKDLIDNTSDWLDKRNYGDKPKKENNMKSNKQFFTLASTQEGDRTKTGMVANKISTAAKNKDEKGVRDGLKSVNSLSKGGKKAIAGAIENTSAGKFYNNLKNKSKGGKQFADEYEDEDFQEEAIEQNEESEEGEGASVDQQLMDLIGDLSDEDKADLLQKLMGSKSESSQGDSPVMFSEQVQHYLEQQSRSHYEDSLPKEVVLQMFSEMATEINSLRRERQLDHTKKKIHQRVRGLSQSQAIAARAYQFSETYGDEVGLAFADALAQLGPKDPMMLPDDYNQFPHEHEALVGQFSEIPDVEREIMKLDEAYETSRSKQNGMSKERYLETNLKAIKLSLKR